MPVYDPGRVRYAWLLPLVLLAAVGLGGALIVWRPDWLAGAVIAGVVGAGFLWLAVSVLWPNRPDRDCPSCGEEALVRLDPETTLGLRCTACPFEDPGASSWFLAEEEGPLEDMVLRQRGKSAHTGDR